MHIGRATKQRYVVAITGLMVMLIGALFLNAITTRTTKAAGVGPSYNWNQLKIGGGGYVTGIALHPTVSGLVYIRTDVGGAYKLGPNDTWQQLITASAVPNPTATDYNVESIAVSKSNAQTLYVAVGNDLSNQTGRILKSTNQGQTFTDNGQRWYMGGNADYRQGGERLVVDPNNDNVVYFGSREQGLWVTNDGGSNWNQVSTSSVPVGSNTGAAAGDKFVIFDPSSGTLNGKTKRIYVGVAGAGIYVSNDAGASWNNVIGVNSSQIPFSASVGSDGTFYTGVDATSGSGEVVRYDPGSNTATTISPSGAGDFEVAVDPTNAQRVIVGSGGLTNGNLWRTTNGGSNWDTLSTSVSSPSIPWATNTDESNYLSSAQLTFDPLVQDKLWFPEGLGLWYSTNNTGSNINWTFYSKGIEETVTSDLIAPPGGSPISNIYDRQGFYHSDVNSYPSQPLIDNAFWGGTSLDYSGGSPNVVTTVEAKNNYSPSLTGRGAISTNGGKSWNLFANTPANNVGGNIAISATNTSNLVWLPSTGNFSHGNPPYYSPDGGQTWTQSTGITDTADTHWLFWWGSKRALTSDKVNGNFYVITTATNGSAVGTFYTSTDGGKTFVQAPNSPDCSANENCHVYGQIHSAPGYANNVWSSGGTDGLWYTTDAGQSAWTKVSGVQEARSFGFGAALPGYSYPAIYLSGKANGDSSEGIYRSADEGATWTLLSTAPLGIYDQVNVTTGDMNTPGRVYVGFTGNGFAYGDDQNLSQEGTPTPGPTPTPTPTQQANVAYAASAPTIDGSSNDAVWSSATSNTISQVQGSPSGFSASFKSAWDSNKLYFLVNVQDSTFSSHADQVEIYLDPNHDGGTSYDSSDMQYAFSSDSSTVVQYHAGQQGTNTGGITFADQNVTGGYQVEIAIPWSDLNLTPAANNVVGLDLDAWQNYGSGVKNKLYWNNASDQDWTNPSLFGSATLQAAPQNTIAHATTAPTIDGNGNDAVWSNATSYPISLVQGSPSGFSASFKSAWDSNKLYFLVNVQDSTFSSHADQVEIYLDPNHDGGTSYDSSDMQYAFSSDSSTVVQYHAGQQGTNTGGITFADKNVTGGYQVEIAIPWSDLSLTPAANKVVGLDLDVWQNYSSGVKNKLYWNNASDQDWTNPSLFGSATLHS